MPSRAPEGATFGKASRARISAGWALNPTPRTAVIGMPLPLFSDLSVIAFAKQDRKKPVADKIWAFGETKVFIQGALMAAGEGSLGLPAGLCSPESHVSLPALGWSQGFQLLPLTSCFICALSKDKTCQHLPLPL